MVELKSARPGFRDYLRAAFREKWNLGLFFAAVGFAVISPFPDAFLPVVVGAEGLYLLSMAYHPRFRQAVDAQAAKRLRQDGAETSTDRYVRLLDRLNVSDRERFRRIIMRCQDMQTLAQGLPGEQREVDEMRNAALDRLLFFFLRLLTTRAGLTAFLSTSNLKDLEAQKVRVTEQLQRAQASKEERLLASLTDTLADLNSRIVNVEKSTKDAEYVDVELQRIEGKVHALAESAISQQDPGALSAQVTAFADTLKLSQDVAARMGSLEDFELEPTDTPSILNSEHAVRVRG